VKAGLVLDRPPGLERRPLIAKKPPSQQPHKEDPIADALAVSIRSSLYLVDFGQEAHPRYHRVNKNKQCSCGAPDCLAIEAVRNYLQAGGKRAPDPQNHPECPICGSKTYRDRVWDGKYTRTLGWRCTQGGLRHFLEVKAQRIRKNQVENPWLIPPAPGYPGVQRDEVMTFEACAALSRKVFLETGSRSTLEEYDPTA
jgi:hypothetical protein